MPDADSLRRILLPVLAILLAACWLGGGATEDPRSVDEWVILLSLPVLVLSVAILATRAQPLRWPERSGIAAVVAIAAVPLLQLLPISEGLWQSPAERAAMASDLANAGVTNPGWRWTLAPADTEHALWSLLPAMAALLAALALPSSQRRRVLQWIVALVFFNVVFAFFQVGLPRDSSLRLYPEFAGGFSGLLVNTNHQATACIIGTVLAVGLAMEARLRVQTGQARSHAPWWYAGMAVAFLLLVPLSTSRAGMVIALPALASALAFTGGLRVARIGRSKRATALAVGLAIIALVGVRSAMGWMAVDQAEEVRHTLSMATLDAGAQYAPLGSGIGSYTRAFEPLAPPSLWLATYINHAHNEYAQWWLTAGWLGMLPLTGVLFLLLILGGRILRLQGKRRQAVIAGACFVAILATLAHSWVDYPLRTLALMATVAALAGTMLAAIQDALEREGAHPPEPSAARAAAFD